MAIARPRTGRCTLAGGSPSSSGRPQAMLPRDVVTPGGSSPSTARPVMVLPEPDSPARPWMRPCLEAEVDTGDDRAGIVVGTDVDPQAVDRAASRGHRLAFPIARPRSTRVERVAQRVAEEVERHHDGQDGQARENADPPRVEVLDRVGHHRAPLGRSVASRRGRGTTARRAAAIAVPMSRRREHQRPGPPCWERCRRAASAARRSPAAGRQIRSRRSARPGRGRG